MTSNNLKKIDYTKYSSSFIISVAIFVTAFLLSNYFSNSRVATLKGIQENISLDILSNSAQFDLLSQVPCDKLDTNILSSELSEIGSKLSFTENERGANDSQIQYLSKYYSLLQIKDYTLSKRLSEKCSNRKTTFIIYFYSSTDKIACEDCRKQSAILTSLREKYKDLRVYSFAIDSDLSAIKTLENIYKINPNNAKLPILIIEDKVYSSFKDFEEIENILPEKLKEKAATSTATTTLKN